MFQCKQTTKINLYQGELSKIEVVPGQLLQERLPNLWTSHGGLTCQYAAICFEVTYPSSCFEAISNYPSSLKLSEKIIWSRCNVSSLSVSVGLHHQSRLQHRRPFKHFSNQIQTEVCLCLSTVPQDLTLEPLKKTTSDAVKLAEKAKKKKKRKRWSN